MGCCPAAGESDATEGNVEKHDGGRPSLCRRVPPVYREEFYNIMKLSAPMAVSRILEIGIKFGMTVFCGHIGSAELAGFALALAIINVCTIAMGIGLTKGCDTLLSQTFGSQNLKRVGVIVQKSFLIMMLFCLPSWGLLLNFSNIARLLQQEESIVRIANVYVVAYMPAIPAVFLFSLMSSYLQNQGITLPQMYCTAITNVFSVISNYVLIFVLELGGTGVAITHSLCDIVCCLLLFAYIRWKKLHLETWDGWSMQCLQDWASYMRLAVPTALVVCFDWWIYEILSVLAGVLGESTLAAQHVISQILILTLMIHLAICDSASVRVGNALGANDTKRAIVSAKIALCLSGTVAVVQGIIIIIIKPYIGYIFTSDPDIVAIVSHILSLNTWFIFFEALLFTSTGICIGIGKQIIVAVANLIAYYGIGLVLGSVLMFTTEIGLLGLWVGLSTGIGIESFFFLVLFYKLDWKKLTIEAQKRSGVTERVDPTNEAQSNGVPDSDHQNAAECDPAGLSTAEGYSLVSTQEPKVDQECEGNKAKASLSVEDVEHSKNTSSQPKVPLSNTQLLLRRGLSVLIVVLLFIIGVVCHIVIPVPEPTVLSQINGTISNKLNVTSTPTSLWGVTLIQSQ